MQERFFLAARELYDGHGFAAKLPNLIASKSVSLGQHCSETARRAARLILACNSSKAAAKMLITAEYRRRALIFTTWSSRDMPKSVLGQVSRARYPSLQRGLPAEVVRT